MSKVGKKFRLTHMVYDEVSHVDAGANQDAHVALMKRDVSKAVSATDDPKGSKKRKRGTTERAENWNESTHTRAPEGSPKGGEFASNANNPSVDRKMGSIKSKSGTVKIPKPKKGGGGGKKGGGKGGGSADAKKKAAEDKKAATAKAKQEKETADANRRQTDLDNSEADKKNIPTQAQVDALSRTGKLDKAPSEKEVPEKTPWGACLIDYETPGIATYSDGTRYSKSGWNFSKTRIKKEEKMAKKLVLKKTDEATHPEQSPAGGDFTEEKDGVFHYADGSTFDGEKWENVPEVEDEDDDDLEDENLEDGEDEDDEEDELADMSKADQGTVGLDALRLAAALTTNIVKVFTNSDVSKRPAEYENAMLAFNRAMDEAANTAWLAGSSVSKRDDSEAISKNVSEIQEVFDKAVQAAGGEIVAKKNDNEKVDIYKGLAPEVVATIKKSEEIIEANEVAKFEDVAKSFTNVPADVTKLGAALRKAHDASPEAYETLTQTLSAANAGLADSEVFKSYGRPGGGETDDDLDSAAAELMKNDSTLTKEQAEIQAMEKNPGKFYTSTVK